MTAASVVEYFEKEGELSVIGNNTPLLLKGSDNIWYIKSGDIDIFSVQNDGTEIKGARIYLFSLTAGSLLFGMDYYDLPGRSFLAVGNTNVHVYKIKYNQLNNFFKNAGELSSFAVLIDKWISSLSGGIARDASLRYDVAIDKAGDLELPENKKIKSKKGVLWLKIEPGKLTLLDSEVNDFNDSRYFPVTDNSWCMTTASFKSFALTTSELLTENSFHNDLMFYHKQVLMLEQLNVRMLAVDDYVRNESKIETLKRIEREAWSNIAGVLDSSSQADEGFTSGDSLLKACKILCDHLGIKLVWPENEEKKKVGLTEIARASKFQFRKVTISKNGWRHDSGPLLAFTSGTKSPVVLIPDIAGKYRIIIPSENVDTRLTPALSDTLSNEAYFFYKPFPYKKITPFEFLKFIYTSSRKEITLLIAAGSIGGLLSLFVPLLTGVIIDSVIPQSDHLKLYGFGLAIIFSVFALIIAQIIRSFSYIRLDTKIEYLVMSALWDRLLNLPVSFFKHFSSGEIASKANSISQLKQLLTFSVINTVVYNSFMIFNLFLLFYYDPMLGFLSSLLFLFYFVIVIVVGIKIKRKNFRIIQLENRITSLINQVLNSISKLKIAGVEKLAFKLWTDKYSVKQKENLEVRRSSNFIVVINSIFPIIAVIFIYALFTTGSYRSLSAGVLISFLTAFNVFLMSIVQISGAAVTFYMAAPLYDNTKEILFTLPEYADKKESIKDLKGEIELSHIYFRYSKEGGYIISDLSMNIKPGEFVAIVGVSGSGKSTLMRLLLGFESPETGAVYYDKHDIELIDKSSLRRRIGTVMQNSKLFPGNIYSNIAGVENISINEVNEIVKVVGLDEDLKSMPMGIYTFINEGLSTLSGGQRQKILLAKAIAMKPSVLLLDEATSALDNESQNVITSNLARIQSTRIVVAHRLSTVKDADRIYVLEKGKIAECGSYEELMTRGGNFTELVKRQITEV